MMASKFLEGVLFIYSLTQKTIMKHNPLCSKNAWCLGRTNTEDNLILRPGGLPSSTFPISFCPWRVLIPKSFVKENFKLAECQAITTQVLKMKEGNVNTRRNLSFPQ